MKTPEFYKECGFEDIGYMPEPLSSSEEYPDYIKEEVLKSVEEIQAHQNEHTMTVAFMTDIHYALNYNHTVRFKRNMRAYREIAKRAQIDLLILGGDYTNEGCKEYKSNAFRELRALIDREPYFPVNGNHDDGSIWDTQYIKIDTAVNHLTHTDLYNLFYNHLPSLGAEFDEKNHALYYMYNDTAKKTRYVFIDSGDVPYMCDEKGALKYPAQWIFTMSQAQLNWLCEKALSFDEEGWSLVFATHTIFRDGYECSSNEIREGMIPFRKILAAYKKGEDICETFGEGDFKVDLKADFSKYTRGDIACVLVGDYHTDAIDVYDGVPHMLTANSVMYDKGAYCVERADGDKRELLFDVVTIDKAQRKIYTVRVGAGENREFNY